LWPPQALSNAPTSLPSPLFQEADAEKKTEEAKEAEKSEVRLPYHLKFEFVSAFICFKENV